MLRQVVLISLLQTCCSANVRQSSTSQTSTVSKPWATLQYEDDEVECRRSGQLIHRVSLNRSVNKDSTPMAKRGDWRPERGQTFSRVPLATWPCPTWGRHESINRNVAVFGLPVLPVGLKPWCPGNSGLPLCAPLGTLLALDTRTILNQVGSRWGGVGGDWKKLLTFVRLLSIAYSKANLIMLSQPLLINSIDINLQRIFS